MGAILACLRKEKKDMPKKIEDYTFSAADRGRLNAVIMIQAGDEAHAYVRTLEMIAEAAQKVHEEVGEFWPEGEYVSEKTYQRFEQALSKVDRMRP